MSFVVGFLIGGIFGAVLLAYKISKSLETNSNTSDYIIQTLKKNGVIK